LKFRKIRNNIAHQYEDEPQQSAEALNSIYAVKPILEKIYTSLKANYVEMRDRINFLIVKIKSGNKNSALNLFQEARKIEIIAKIMGLSKSEIKRLT
jgi:hypothetical protein